jgi:hypothetical protein
MGCQVGWIGSVKEGTNIPLIGHKGDGFKGPSGLIGLVNSANGREGRVQGRAAAFVKPPTVQGRCLA